MRRPLLGLCLVALMTSSGSHIFASETAGSPPATETLARLTAMAPEDLLADTVVSQVSSLASAFSDYESSHGLYSPRTVTFESLVAESFLSHLPRPPEVVSSGSYQFDAATSRISLRLDGRDSGRVCDAINRREAGHCVSESGRLQFWENVGQAWGSDFADAQT